jgi:hypothetical protein
MNSKMKILFEIKIIRKDGNEIMRYLNKNMIIY